MRAALELLGAQGVEPSDSDPAAPRAGTIASLDWISTLADAELEAATGASEGAPLFIHPGPSGLSAEHEAVLGKLGGAELTIVSPGPIASYEFSEDGDLWPFSGLALDERRPRVAATVDTGSSAAEPLISTTRGCTFLRWQRGSQSILLSSVPLPELGSSDKLKEEFGPARFAALLPLLVFARLALGEGGWRTPVARANLLVDDPNLRFHRYGFMDYRTVVEAARDRELHFTIAMSPIDHRKTREPVARFMRENSRYMSLVPHGVEHLKREFEREVGVDAALAALRDGMRRMAHHGAETGVSSPAAMTLPHGGCNATWLEAMRRTGLDATFASRSFPFLSDSEVNDPLYEMLPAELGHRGYPVINRFKAEEPTERLLFQAWLGKPLVVYTHHEFFRDGMDRTFEITDLLRRQVDPRWGNIESILEGNFQSRRTEHGLEIRAYSNSISIDPGGETIAGLRKPAGEADEEIATVNGVEAAVRADGAGLLVAEPGDRHDPASVRFLPAAPGPDGPGYRTPARARLRRLATEARDHSMALAARSRRRRDGA